MKSSVLITVLLSLLSLVVISCAIEGEGFEDFPDLRHIADFDSDEEFIGDYVPKKAKVFNQHDGVKLADSAVVLTQDDLLNHFIITDHPLKDFAGKSAKEMTAAATVSTEIGDSESDTDSDEVVHHEEQTAAKSYATLFRDHDNPLDVMKGHLRLSSHLVQSKSLAAGKLLVTPNGIFKTVEIGDEKDGYHEVPVEHAYLNDAIEDGSFNCLATSIPATAKAAADEGQHEDDDDEEEEDGDSADTDTEDSNPAEQIQQIRDIYNDIKLEQLRNRATQFHHKLMDSFERKLNKQSDESMMDDDQRSEFDAQVKTARNSLSEPLYNTLMEAVDEAHKQQIHRQEVEESESDIADWSDYSRSESESSSDDSDTDIDVDMEYDEDLYGRRLIRWARRAVRRVGRAFRRVGRRLSRSFRRIGRGIRRFASRIGRGIRSAVSRFRRSKFWRGLKRGVRTVWGKIKKGVKKVVDAGLKLLPKKVRNWLKDVGGKLKSVFQKIASTVKSFGKTVFKLVKGIIKKVGEGLVSLAKLTFQTLRFLLTGSFKWSLPSDLMKAQYELKNKDLINKKKTVNKSSSGGAVKFKGTFTVLARIVHALVKFEPRMIFKGEIKTFRLKYFKAAIGAKLALIFKFFAKVTAAGLFRADHNFYSALIHRIQFQIGPVPVWIDFYFSIDGGVVAKAVGYAQYTSGREYRQTLELGAEYKGKWRGIKTNEKKEIKHEPKFNMCIDIFAEAFLRASLSIKAYSNDGPVFILEPYLRFEFHGDGRKNCDGKKVKDIDTYLESASGGPQSEDEQLADIDITRAQLHDEIWASKHRLAGRSHIVDSDSEYGSNIADAGDSESESDDDIDSEGEGEGEEDGKFLGGNKKDKYKVDIPNLLGLKASPAHPSYWILKIGVRFRVGIDFTISNAIKIMSWRWEIFDKSKTLAKGCVNIGMRCLKDKPQIPGDDIGFFKGTSLGPKHKNPVLDDKTKGILMKTLGERYGPLIKEVGKKFGSGGFAKYKGYYDKIVTLKKEYERCKDDLKKCSFSKDILKKIKGSDILKKVQEWDVVKKFKGTFDKLRGKVEKIKEMFLKCKRHEVKKTCIKTKGKIIKRGKCKKVTKSRSRGRSTTATTTKTEKKCVKWECSKYCTRTQETTVYEPCTKWAKTWAEPHITTLDGYSYTLATPGDFVLMKTKGEGEGESAVVVARSQPAHDTKGKRLPGTVFTAVAVKVGEESVEIYSRPSLVIVANGKKQDLGSLEGGKKIRLHSGIVLEHSGKHEYAIIATKSHIAVAVKIENIPEKDKSESESSLNVDFRVSSSLFGGEKLVGLLGNYDGKVSNDKVDVHDYLLTTDESPLSTVPYHVPSGYEGVEGNEIGAMSKKMRLEAVKVCKACKGLSADRIKACIYDVAITSNPNWCQAELDIAKQEAHDMKMFGSSGLSKQVEDEEDDENVTSDLASAHVGLVRDSDSAPSDGLPKVWCKTAKRKPPAGSNYEMVDCPKSRCTNPPTVDLCIIKYENGWSLRWRKHETECPKKVKTEVKTSQCCGSHKCTEYSHSESTNHSEDQGHEESSEQQCEEDVTEDVCEKWDKKKVCVEYGPGSRILKYWKKYKKQFPTLRTTIEKFKSVIKKGISVEKYEKMVEEWVEKMKGKMGDQWKKLKDSSFVEYVEKWKGKTKTWEKNWREKGQKWQKEWKWLKEKGGKKKEKRGGRRRRRRTSYGRRRGGRRRRRGGRRRRRRSYGRRRRRRKRRRRTTKKNANTKCTHPGRIIKCDCKGKKTSAQVVKVSSSALMRYSALGSIIAKIERREDRESINRIDGANRECKTLGSLSGKMLGVLTKKNMKKLVKKDKRFKTYRKTLEKNVTWSKATTKANMWARKKAENLNHEAMKESEKLIGLRKQGEQGTLIRRIYTMLKSGCKCKVEKTCACKCEYKCAPQSQFVFCHYICVE